MDNITFNMQAHKERQHRNKRDDMDLPDPCRCPYDNNDKQLPDRLTNH